MGKRAGLRHADPKPGRTVPAFKILTLNLPGILAALGRKTLRFVPTAAPPPMLLTIAHHGEMAMDYYLKALKIIEDRIGKDIIVFVFSDDPEWCAFNFKLPYEMCTEGRPTPVEP